MRRFWRRWRNWRRESDACPPDVGIEARGPQYLLQFTDPQTVTEYTQRRGFAPEEASKLAIWQSPAML
jgi:hypothetical protein